MTLLTSVPLKKGRRYWQNMRWKLSNFKENLSVILEGNVKLSYEDLQKATDQLAEHIPDRCLIFSLCSNTIGSLLGYISFINHRIVPLMLDAHINRELLYSLMENYKPDYFWLPSSMANEFGHFKEIFSIYKYSLIKTPYTKEFPLYEDLALLLTTSGSTGSPKLVRQSYKNIKANTESIVKYLELNETERPITTLPMSYTYGLSIINSHLYVGASIILTEKSLMDREFWHLFKEYEATSFGGVPYTYEILDKLRFFRMELPSLRTMTQAGGKLSLKLHKKFAEYALENGKHFVVMYGQTEATARMSYLPYEKSLEKCGSIGIPIPNGSFSLIDEDGNEINEPDVTGELVYKGDNVTLGYAECGSDLIKGDEFKGKLYTGDLAKRDSDGYYYIVGRKKRFLKIYGNRVSLDETEQIIKSQFDFDCACSGMDDIMYVFITDMSRIDDVKKFLSEKTGLNHLAFKVKYIPSIPKNDSGKILYSALEEYYD